MKILADDFLRALNNPCQDSFTSLLKEDISVVFNILAGVVSASKGITTSLLQVPLLCTPEGISGR